MNELALCAGYSGLGLGLRLALADDVPFRTLCYVEREAHAAATLVARMEDQTLGAAPVWDDLRSFDAGEFRGLVDVVTAGYPCQPFSLAGKGLADRDPRHLWPHVRRVVGEARPACVFLENVPGHIRRGLGDVLADLDALGFDAEWTTLSAGACGAPHRRDRLWILAWQREGFDHLGPGGVPHALRDRLWVESERGKGAAQAPEQRDPVDAHVGQDVADADGLDRKRRADLKVWGSQGRETARWDRAELADADSGGLEGERRGGLLDRERAALGDHADGRGPWPPGPSDFEGWRQQPAFTQPGVRGVAHGSSTGVDQRERLALLGNGVVPVAAAAAFTSLIYRACEKVD